MTENFIWVSLIGLAMIFATCLIMYEIFRAVWAVLPKLTVTRRVRVILVVIPIFTAHILNIWLYALAYFLIENHTSIGTVQSLLKVPTLDSQTFFDCLYFSSATYTTLGFGDIIPTHDLRMLTGTEALNGLVLMGWTISFTFLAMEDFWKSPSKKSNNN